MCTSLAFFFHQPKVDNDGKYFFPFHSTLIFSQTTNVVREGGVKSYSMEWRQDWLHRYAAAGKNDRIEIEEKNERNVFGVDRIF